MERQFQCPSCGAGNVVTNPGILMKVCDFCKTAIYWDKESALRAGNKSVDLPPSSRFKVGATGKIRGNRFTVLGRLVYAHDKGTWSEWFVEMKGGDILWLAEDEGELFLEKPLTLQTPAPSFDQLYPGMEITLNDRTGVVEELGVARCLGGEGQIPFEVEIGEIYPYADGTAADGSFIFGLEYDEGAGQPRAFTGQALSVGDSKAPARVAQPERAKTGEAIRCASCGKPYEGKRVTSTEMVVCDACGSALQLDEAEVRVVGKNVGPKPRFSLEIGTPVTFGNTKFEVMGRLYYVEVDEGIEYPSYEYILYNAEKGYLWLSEEKGHFTVSSPEHIRTVIPDYISAKARVQVGKESFRFYERGEATLRWVDGALPWAACVGEKTSYVHLIKPPEYVDREITGSEMELFRGRYVSRDEMIKALPPGIELPLPRGVYSCQPYVPSEWIKGLGWIGGVFVMLNLLLFIYSFVAEKNTVLMEESLAAEKYSKEHLTKPFKIERDGEILRLKGSAPLNNSWLALDFAVVDSEDRVLKEFWNEAAYYSGYDSEGHWSEGSPRFSSCFKVEKAGNYRLLVHAQGGSGDFGPARNEPVRLTLESGATISWYFIVPMILACVFMFVGLASREIFESRRWSDVVEDADDDD